MALVCERSCFFISGFFFQILVLITSLSAILGQNGTDVTTNVTHISVNGSTIFSPDEDITVSIDNSTDNTELESPKNGTRLQKLTNGEMSAGTITTISVLATLAVVVLVILAGLLIYTKGKLFILCRRRSANVSPHERLEEQAADGNQQEQVPDSVAQIEPQLRQENSG